MYYSLDVLCSSLWIIHLSGMGFDYMMSVPFLLSHCGFFFMSLDVQYLSW